MMLMLRRLIAIVFTGLALAGLPLIVHADNSLVSPGSSASVLQPTPSQSLQTGADQSSSASATYLNDELVGGEQGGQASAPESSTFPWGDVVAAALLAVGLIGLLVILYRSRRTPQAMSDPIVDDKPEQKPKPKTKPKPKPKPKPKAKGRAKKR